MGNLTGNRHRTRSFRLTDEQRFEMKVDRTGDCHVWLAGKNVGGYGTFYFRGRTWVAHRAALAMAGVEIPDLLVVDHLCRNPACVRLEHLEIVTEQVNILRGTAPAAFQAQQTHCMRGHLLPTEPNDRGHRRCLVCYNAQRRERRRLVRLAA